MKYMLSMPKDVHSEVKVEAYKKGMSMNEFILSKLGSKEKLPDSLNDKEVVKKEIKKVSNEHKTYFK